MSDIVTIDTAYVQQFEQGFIHLAQQKDTRLLRTVRVKSVKGKYTHFDRLGAMDLERKDSLFAPTPLADPQHSRRRLFLETYHKGVGVDPDSVMRMLTDPTDEYATALRAAVGRKIDDVIIAAAVGNALAVDADDASSNVAFDANMVIDEDIGADDSNLNFEKLLAARKVILGKDVDPETELVCLLNQSAIEALMKETEITSFDYNSARVLTSGKMSTFLGFTFIPTERLTDSSEGFKQILVYSKEAIGVGIGRDMKVSVDKRPDLSNIMQVYVDIALGAVRIQEEHIAIIECAQ